MAPQLLSTTIQPTTRVQAPRQAPRVPTGQHTLGGMGTHMGPGIAALVNSQQPQKAAPKPPPAPAGPPPSGGTAQALVTPYLDSTALGNIATNTFKVGNQITGLNEKQRYADTDLQRALRTLSHNTALSERNAQEKANTQGLLSSTTLANNLGEIGQSAGDRQTALNTANTRLHASTASQIAALYGGIPLYNNEQAAGATTRGAAIAANDKALGLPIPAGLPGGPPLHPAPAPARAPIPTTTRTTKIGVTRPPHTLGGMFGRGGPVSPALIALALKGMVK